MSLSVVRPLVAAGLLVTGVAAGSVLPSSWRVGGGEVERARIGAEILTSPFLECAGERDSESSIVHARRHIARYLRSLQAADTTLRVSVYARDLLEGHWIGIDEHRPMEPASLMKMSVLFHALARMESDPALAARTSVYPGPEAMPSPDNLIDRPADERMTPGAAYRFDELVERMIVYSDNHAKDMVLSGVDPAEVEAFMASVGLPRQVYEGRAVMDVHALGALFRVLYNSSVFSRPTSEFALGLLVRSRYPDGLREPLPPNVLVASKHGIYRDAVYGSQTHECGIIYAPGAPYVLCVMTQSRRQSTTELARILQEVSRLAFEEGLGEEP